MIEINLASSNCRTSDLGHWNNIKKERIRKFVYLFHGSVSVDCNYECENSLAESIQYTICMVKRAPHCNKGNCAKLSDTGRV